MSNVVKVELLVDVAEGGRDLAKAIVAADAFGLDKAAPNYPRLKVTVTPRGRTEFVSGLVVSMPKPSADKWVSKGLGKIVG